MASAKSLFVRKRGRNFHVLVFWGIFYILFRGGRALYPLVVFFSFFSFRDGLKCGKNKDFPAKFWWIIPFRNIFIVIHAILLIRVQLIQLLGATDNASACDSIQSNWRIETFFFANADKPNRNFCAKVYHCVICTNSQKISQMYVFWTKVSWNLLENCAEKQ